MAFIKRIIKRDGELFPQLEKFEQTYKSEESKCWELRKGLEGSIKKTSFLCMFFCFVEEEIINVEVFESAVGVVGIIQIIT